MAAILTVVFVVVLSLLTTRVAATALALTGMSRESARFQARSALTGSGFTTSESESVVNHPVRRRIIMLLMLVGRAGIVTVMASLTVSFAGIDDRREGLTRVGVLALALVALVLVTRSRTFDRMMNRLIERALRRYTSLDTRDYAGLLHLAGDYAVVELHVAAGAWTAGRPLRELQLREEGIVVLGIERADGSYEGAPGPETVPNVGDTLVLYGRDSAVCTLNARHAGWAGDREHREAVAAGPDGDDAEPAQRS